MPRLPEPEHGTRRCYLSGCRRPECKAAHARYMFDWKRRAQKPRARVEHGVSTYLNHGCRCMTCTRAHDRYLSDAKMRQLPQPTKRTHVTDSEFVHGAVLAPPDSWWTKIADRDAFAAKVAERQRDMRWSKYSAGTPMHC